MKSIYFTIKKTQLINLLLCLITFSLSKCNSQYNIIKMKNEIEKDHAKLLRVMSSVPYSDEFAAMLGNKCQMGNSYEYYELLASYSLSRLVEEIIFKIQLSTEKTDVYQLKDFLVLVFQNQNIKKIINFFLAGSQKFKLKQQKDRKTSFFRTVIKHLKQKSKKKLKNMLKNSTQLIDQIQQKLSNNTISKQDIDQLYLKYGSEIIEYLQSQKCYKDFIFVNKSKTSKAYYILHLKQIAIETKNGRLSSYPFFLRSNIIREIQKLVQVFYDQWVRLSFQNLNQKYLHTIPENKDGNFIVTTHTQLSSQLGNQQIDQTLDLENLNCRSFANQKKCKMPQILYEQVQQVQMNEENFFSQQFKYEGFFY